MEQIKEEIKQLEIEIQECQEFANIWQRKIGERRGKIIQLQRKCNHDFETIGTYCCHIVKCKICGYTTGG